MSKRGGSDKARNGKVKMGGKPLGQELAGTAEKGQSARPNPVQQSGTVSKGNVSTNVGVSRGGQVGNQAKNDDGKVDVKAAAESLVEAVKAAGMGAGSVGSRKPETESFSAPVVELSASQ